MATAVKRKATASTSGKAIKVVATATPGTTIHTAVAGTTPGTFDEIYLWAYNHNTSAVVLTIEGGGATVPDDIMMVTLAPQSGWIPIEPGFILQNSLVVSAFASVANKVTIRAFINSMTD